MSFAPRTRGKDGNDPIDAAYLELMELCEREGKQFVKAKEFAEQIADGRLAMIQAVQIVIDLLKPRRGQRMSIEEAAKSLESERDALLTERDGIDDEIDKLRKRKAEIGGEAKRLDKAIAKLTGEKRERYSQKVDGPIEFEGRAYSAGDVCPYCNEKELSTAAVGRIAHLKPCKAKHPKVRVA